MALSSFISLLFIFVLAFFTGFLSHLLLDLSTPMGLPLFCGKSILGLITVPLYLVPFLNILMIIFTIALGLISITYLAKKIGGKLAMMILFIPIWSFFLVFSIALLPYPGILRFLGVVFLFLTIIIVGIILVIGYLLDIVLKKGETWLNNRQMYTSLKNPYGSFARRKIKTGRNPLLAAFVSLIMPGLGQLYNGETVKGILYFFGFYMVLTTIIVIYLLMAEPSIGISLICCLPIFIVPIIFSLGVSYNAYIGAKKVNKENGF
jgi:hypothetical protein